VSTEPGQDHNPRPCSIWGTPWPSTANLADSGDAPLRALVFVRRGADPVLHEMRPVEALRHVLRTLALPFWSRALLDRALPLVDRLLAETRAFEFAYAPRAGAGSRLVELLDRRLGGG
jgi:hypothetical protein